MPTLTAGQTASVSVSESQRLSFWSNVAATMSVAFTNATGQVASTKRYGPSAFRHQATQATGGGSYTLTCETGVVNYAVSGIDAAAVLTVAALPSAAISGVGALGFVTDALTPTFGASVAGGGAVPSPVYSDGTTWKVG